MQRDTSLSLGEIHGTKSELLAALERIDLLALTKSAGDKTPLRLRLLTPYPGSRSKRDFALTSADDFIPDQPYIAVSYTWAYKGPVQHGVSVRDLLSMSSPGWLGRESKAETWLHTHGNYRRPTRDPSAPDDEQIPEYRIWDTSGLITPPRRLRCPAAMFHRAMRYAIAKGCPYIWIDQECIDQTDPMEVERHLRIMHRIYRRSRTTISVLATPAPQSNILRELAQVLDYWSITSETTSPRGRVHLDAISFELFDWLFSATQDKWFTRTWYDTSCAFTCDHTLTIPTQSQDISRENVFKIHGLPIPHR